MNDSLGYIYLVPTPIGNMDDISKRMIDVMESSDIIACEDTRHSGSYLKKLGIHKKLVSYHDFNETARSKELVELVLAGKNISVITDGGSPGISDPAYRIVRMAIEYNLTVIPIPGPTAIIPALTASGLPTDRFFFEGFLSNKSAARKKRLGELAEYPHTLVFYESPHRIHKMAADVLDVLGEREICIAREISKKFEEFIRGSSQEIVQLIEKRTLKGEIVVIVEGNRRK